MIDELTRHQRLVLLLGAAPSLRSGAQPQTRSCWEVGADVAIRPAKSKDRRTRLGVRRLATDAIAPPMAATFRKS